MDLLLTRNHQIVLGRRGSGKTHTLLALAQRTRAVGDLAVFIDLSQLGSNSSVYGDPELSLSERGSRLFLDIALALHEELHRSVYDPGRLGAQPEDAVATLQRRPDLPQRLDELAEAATDVRIVGPTERVDTVEATREHGREAGLDLGLREARTSVSYSSHDGARAERQTKQSGDPRHYVHFGRLKDAVTKVVESFLPRRVWLLLDEWNSIPLDLQPYIGDLLRRALMPIDGLVVKIGAIQHRSNWVLHGSLGSYTGLELGSDIFAEVSLDEFQVGFGRTLAQRFFRELIYKHVIAELGLEQNRKSVGQLKLPLFNNEADFLEKVFRGDKAFEEFVDSAEGVPRDGIAIIGLAAQSADAQRITVPHIRDAARRWHEESKLPVIERHAQARLLLNYILDIVIDQRKTRGFVVRQTESTDALFSFLVDQRLLHRIRRSIASHDEPGIRFDAYVVDYGFYVDRRTTKSEPLPLEFEDPSGRTVAVREVPTVDYRSVRKAVLSLATFYVRNEEPPTGWGIHIPRAGRIRDQTEMDFDQDTPDPDETTHSTGPKLEGADKQDRSDQ
jgi:predicted transcriptional regulator